MKKTLLAQVHCGSCTFLQRDKVFESNCATLGKIPSSKACQSHIPNVFNAINSKPKVDMLSNLSHVMSILSVSELQSLGTLMIREKITRKSGYSFNQKVYVRIMGAGNSNFLSNFVVGFVLDANPEFVRVVGESGKVTMQVVNDPNSNTLYTVERFNVLRTSMLSKKALVDTSQAATKSGRVYTSVLPLDVAVSEDLVSNKKVRKSEPDDLVSLARRLGSGQLRTKEKKNLRSASGSVVIANW